MTAGGRAGDETGPGAEGPGRSTPSPGSVRPCGGSARAPSPSSSSGAVPGQGEGRHARCSVQQRLSHRKRGAETKFQNNPQEKSGPVWRAKRLTFVPSFPARPGSPCSPGGPGGPGWPRSPIGPVSPVGPCGENRVSHKFRGAHGVTCLNLRTALATGVKGHRVATTLRGAWQVSFW